MAKLGTIGKLRLEAAHAPFRVGMRVRINETFPYYGEHGTLGTITRLPIHLSARHVHVLFDGRTRENEYAKGYLTPVDEASAANDEQ